jgi:hypothetical protein
MAASTLANLETSLKRMYSDETFEVALNIACPYWQSLQEYKGENLEGEGYYWPFYLASPQNIGTPGENANLPSISQRLEVQGRMRPAQFIATFELSFILEAMGSARGSWNKGEVKRHMKEAIDDLSKHANRMYAGTHGTGRLAKVQDNAVGATFIGAIGAAGEAEPHGVQLLRPNMKITPYSDDTGSGTAREAAIISKIVQGTRVVTTDTTLTTTVAGDGVYITGSYGQTTVPNGLMGIVDDGTLLTTIHNQSRTTYEDLKATVLTGGGALSPLTEADLLNGAFTVKHLTGQKITDILMNVGMLDAYLAFVRPDRRYPVAPGQSVPDYKTGYNEDKLEFLWGGGKATITCIDDLPPRTVIGLTKDKLRRFNLRKMTWDQSSGGIFKQGVNSSGYKTTQQATLVHLENLGSFQPNSAFRIGDKLDRILCGASRAGTDSF